ncbi:flagellar hook-associated protein FlgK [Romboutsia hominis]|uniref:flagellar hook-associated protein FlgK n=1 Tax=Romboutsia hominis TaxID=1507512 RepID=UPI000AB9983F|nr:flagellar hook-associated protein FlgK [Romboutsia hominis]
MSGLLGSLQTAKSGMSVSQTSIQTTSHNINNMNTPGYSRQRVQQSARSAYSYPGYNSSMGAGQLGTGVEATDIIRIRNTFFDFQFRNESHNYGKISTKSEYYTNMETIFNEPSDTSISSSLSNFFSSWNEISKNPNDSGSKNTVVQNAKYLATNISNLKNKLEKLSSQANDKINKNLNEINDMVDQLRGLNKNIRIVEGSGKTPNDLLDEKDKVLDKLSYKFNIEDNNVKNLIEKKINDGTSITLDDIKAIGDVSGEIQGSIDMIDKINEYTSSIDDLSEGIANGINDVLGIDFFEFDKKGNPSLKVKDDYLTDSNKLSVSSKVAGEIFRFKDKKMKIGSEPEITIDKFYNNIVQKLGNESQEVIRSEKNQNKIINEIENSRTNVSGVLLDEEMINLVQFQHAYNASAKVISTIDSLLDVVINGLKR